MMLGHFLLGLVAKRANCGIFANFGKILSILFSYHTGVAIVQFLLSSKIFKFLKNLDTLLCVKQYPTLMVILSKFKSTRQLELSKV